MILCTLRLLMLICYTNYLMENNKSRTLLKNRVLFQNKYVTSSILNILSGIKLFKYFNLQGFKFFQ